MQDIDAESPAGELSISEQVLSSYAMDALGDVDPAWGRLIVDRLKGNGDPGLDYQLAWREFQKLYLLINYRKTLAALEAVAPAPVSSLLDVGTGGGAAAVAALEYFAGRAIREGRDGREGLPERVVLVDRSRSQVESAAERVTEVADRMSASIIVEPVVADAAHLPLQQAYGLVIAAHVVTENASNVGQLLAALHGGVREDGVLLIIERPDDPVVDQLESFGLVTGSTQGSALGSVRGGTVDQTVREWKLAWFAFRGAGRAPVTSAVDRYFRAWREQSVEQLASVFTPDAVYHERPHDPPLVGIEGIREYWQREVLTQDRPRVDVLDARFHESSAAVEWEARFTRSRFGYRVRGIMMLDVDLETGRIWRLRECFNTHKTT